MFTTTQRLIVGALAETLWVALAVPASAAVDDFEVVIAGGAVRPSQLEAVDAVDGSLAWAVGS